MRGKLEDAQAPRRIEVEAQAGALLERIKRCRMGDQVKSGLLKDARRAGHVRLSQGSRLVARRAAAYFGLSIQGSAMKPLRDVVAAIGRTPLIKLRTASEATQSTILGKAIGIAMAASAWGFGP